MKVRSACAAVVSIGTALLLLAGIHSSPAAEIKLVSPQAYENTEGETGIGEGPFSPFRYQQAFPAADFAALGGRPHWITSFRFRPDQSLTSPRTVTFPDNQIRLSTTTTSPANLSSRFDDNFGADVTQVYRGPVTLVADADSLTTVPRKFYHKKISYQEPFLYDPSQGNLLLDVIAWGGASPSTVEDKTTNRLTTGLFASTPTATSGQRVAAGIFQFTFVPVIIINGGFETPDTPTYMQINAGQNTIAPWVVGGHSVEVGDAAGNGFITGPAFEGAQYLDLNGLGRGRLTQAFATTPGLLYTVTFAYSNNYFNSSSPASATVRLFDALGDRMNQTITHTSAVAGDLKWSVFNGQFTALQNNTSLEFTSLTDTDGYSGGIMLDAVQIFEDVSLKILSITGGASGPVVLSVLGVPNGVHRIQASVDLSVGSFIDIATVTADAAGLFQFQDTRAGLTRNFYRAVFP